MADSFRIQSDDFAKVVLMESDGLIQRLQMEGVTE